LLIIIMLEAIPFVCCDIVAGSVKLTCSLQEARC